MDFAPNVLALTVAHSFMGEILFQETVARMFIGSDQIHSLADRFPDKGIQGEGVCILNNLGTPRFPSG
jgi:hypothetical protein